MAPINLEIGENDHIPPDFTLEQMKAALDMTEEEALRMTKGEDPMFSAEQVAKAFPKPVDAPDNPLDAVPAQTGQVPATPPAAPQPAADAVPAAPAAPVTTAAPPPLPDLPDLTDAKKIADNYMTEVEALNAKYEDGDMTKAEWTAAIAAQADAAATAKATIMQAQNQADTFHKTFVAQWKPVISAFQAQHPHLDINNPARDPVVYDAWDKALYQVNTSPEYAHLGLQARAELVYDVLAPQMRAMGKVFPDRVAAPVPPADPTPAPGLRTDPRPDPMQTLAGLANASLPPVNDSTFAAIDTLDPEAAEAAMARMTPEQMDKYLYSYGGGYYGTEG